MKPIIPLCLVAILTFSGCGGDPAPTVTPTPPSATPTMVLPSSTPVVTPEPTETVMPQEIEDMRPAIQAHLYTLYGGDMEGSDMDAYYMWVALHNFVDLVGEDHALITVEDGNWKVPRQGMQECATYLFADYDELPSLPEGFEEVIRYDETWDAYFMGQMGGTGTDVLTISQWQEVDEGYELTASLHIAGVETEAMNWTVTLASNTYSDGITDPLCSMTVSSVTMQD